MNALNGEQKQILSRWLVEENRSYEEVRGLMATELGVATSLSALCRYYRRCLAKPVMIRGGQKAESGWSEDGTQATSAFPAIPRFPA